MNLDEAKYGTFAEIGAGQEVAGSSSRQATRTTPSKVAFGRRLEIQRCVYGRSARHVSREDWNSGLTVSTNSSFNAWTPLGATGLRFSCLPTRWQPRASRHHMKPRLDGDAVPGCTPNTSERHHSARREWRTKRLSAAAGSGHYRVNLVFGAFYYINDQDRIIRSLADSLTSGRIEVDMINFAGPLFANVDNRIMSLKLVEYELTNAVMFSPKGEVLQPSEILYKKAVVVERGSFRPVTLVNLDMMRCALAQFIAEPVLHNVDVVVLMEITMHNLLATGNIDYADFLARIDTLAAIGNNVFVSNYLEFYRLIGYFRRYTKHMVGVVMGINNLLEVFNERYYENLDGGILESFGRLFRNLVKLYIYPMRINAYDRYCMQNPSESPTTALGKSEHPLAVDVWINAINLQVELHLRNLYAHLLESGFLVPIVGSDPSVMDIFSRDVLAKIQHGEPGWDTMVPEKVAAIIRERGLFRRLGNSQAFENSRTRECCVGTSARDCGFF